MSLHFKLEGLLVTSPRCFAVNIQIVIALIDAFTNDKGNFFYTPPPPPHICPSKVMYKK